MRKNLFVAVLMYCLCNVPCAHGLAKGDSTKKEVVLGPLVKIVTAPKVKKSDVSDSTWTKMSNDVFVLTDGINRLSPDSLVSFYEAVKLLKLEETFVTELEVLDVVRNAMHSAVENAKAIHNGELKKRLIRSFTQCTDGKFHWEEPVTVTDQEDDRKTRKRHRKD